ncbi:MAG: septal ring lytic transglycosylase RlpA family protein, partial [Alphaproteobacteria bacterium]
MMRRISALKTPAFVLVSGFFLAACAETQLVVHSAKELAGTNNTKSVAKTRGQYKVGKPYRIKNTWYYPAEDFSYTETGIASWYGPKFHGRKTANGETFDMNTLTAAHRTLPMPSLVRVINLSNGRSLLLKVNDRGPFARNRIIDVSRRAAQLLGFQRQGTARVRVEIVADESQRMKLEAMNGRVPPREQIVAGPVPREVVVQQPLDGQRTDARPDIRTAKRAPVKAAPHRPVTVEKVPVGDNGQGTPIYLKDIAQIQIGPDMQRGLAELD